MPTFEYMHVAGSPVVILERSASGDVTASRPATGEEAQTIAVLESLHHITVLLQELLGLENARWTQGR